ncbi:LysR substrate-binding domain-containing protein, partial [Acinetobacter baumannii]
QYTSMREPFQEYTNWLINLLNSLLVELDIKDPTPLPQLLNECMQQHPNLPLELQTHPTGYLLNAVQQGEVDCAFVASKYVIPELY